MNTVIYIYSYHKGNTRKVAEAMAPMLGASIIEIAKDGSVTKELNLNDYDLVGFGAGIAFSKHYKQLLQFAGELDTVEGKKAFIFSTAGLHSKEKMIKHHSPLHKILAEKGFEIVDEFACKGHDTFSVLKLIGGINKGRPNEEDLQKAKEFAQGLLGNTNDEKAEEAK